jgi:hypothetical protein
MVGALVVGLCVAGLAPASASPTVGAGVGGSEEAFAGWTFMTSRTHGVFYFADAWRSVYAPTGLDAQGVVGKGLCEAAHGKGFTIIICFAQGHAHPVSLDQFQMDPLLRSATLDLEVRGAHHHVSWHGDGSTPGVGEFAGVGAGWAQAGVADARPARARATLFGRKLGGGGLPFAFLGMGAGAAAIVWPTGSLARRIGPDGSVLYRYERRIPNR